MAPRQILCGMLELVHHMNQLKNSDTYQAMFDILEADIVVMQETKIQRKDLGDDMVLVPGWDVYFSLPKHKKGILPSNTMIQKLILLEQDIPELLYTLAIPYARPFVPKRVSLVYSPLQTHLQASVILQKTSKLEVTHLKANWAIVPSIPPLLIRKADVSSLSFLHLSLSGRIVLRRAMIPETSSDLDFLLP